MPEDAKLTTAQSKFLKDMRVDRSSADGINHRPLHRIEDHPDNAKTWKGFKAACWCCFQINRDGTISRHNKAPQYQFITADGEKQDNEGEHNELVCNRIVQAAIDRSIVDAKGEALVRPLPTAPNSRK